MIEINKNTSINLKTLDMPVSVVPLIDGEGGLWFLNESNARSVRLSIQYLMKDKEWFKEFIDYLESLYKSTDSITWSNKYDIDNAILYFLMFHKKKGTIE